MKRNKLSKALVMATAIGGLAGGVFTQPAGAVNLSQMNLGDALIFPYYTVRDGWQTLFNVTNTSEATVVVKFHFLEGYNSRDVLDFTVVLSPKDVFSGYVQNDPPSAGFPQGRPVFYVSANETSCVVPIQTSYPMLTESYSTAHSDHSAANDDLRPDGTGGLSDIDRSKEGYVVAIVEGYSPAGRETTPAPGVPGVNSVAYNAKHVAGVPRNCTNVANAFLKSNIVLTASEFGEPINALKGNYNFLNVAEGISAGGNAVTLANFVAINRNDGLMATNDSAVAIVDAQSAGVGTPPSLPSGPLAPKPGRALCTATNGGTNMFFNPVTSRRSVGTWDPAINIRTDCPNLIAAQQPYDYLEPTLADAYPNTAVSLDDDLAGVPVTAGNPPWGPFAQTGWVFSNFSQGWGGYGYGYWAVSEALRTPRLMNEWSLNRLLGVTTEWVITHPTKNFFVDKGASVFSANSQQNFPFDQFTRLISVPYPPFSEAFGGVVDGQSCNEIGVTVWDRNETQLSLSTIPVVQSPVPRYGYLLCFEANVIRFTTQTSVFGSKLTLNLADPAFNLSGANNAGWMDVNLAAALTARSGAVVSVPQPVGAVVNLLPGDGLPAVGFMIKQRIFGPASSTNVQNYGYLADHSYKGRGVPAPVFLTQPLPTLNQTISRVVDDQR